MVYYYTIVEDIPQEEILPNQKELLIFILVWHYVFMVFKNYQIEKLKNNQRYRIPLTAIGILAFLFVVLSLILWPIFSAVSMEIATIDTSYNKTRFTYLGFYIVLNILGNVLPLFNTFFFFISDGILLV